MASLSDFLGYCSIGCWLGAQFPQVVENYRRRSVEGLSLPFLANWLLGDFSNLLGCILTHQLPFQTYLATYFCFVDVALVSQYFYYTSIAKPKPLPYARGRAGSTVHRRTSIERGPAHYRALSSVAANVAAAAALAAQTEEQTRWHRPSLESRSHSARGEIELESDEEIDEATLARLADSFHSEGGRSRKKVSWDRGRRSGSLGRVAPTALSPSSRAQSALYISPPTEEFDYLTRGRPLSREPRPDNGESEWAEASAQRRSSRASRKGASMVFLGVWALFGFGTLAGTQRGLPTSLTTARVGRVLSGDPVAVAAMPVPTGSVSDQLMTAAVQPATSSIPIHFEAAEPVPPRPPPEHERPSTEYIIGRISAWICTTLYLTSRLPQIWKNFARKSVEGLSIYLFVFAFLGNCFYVASLLTSPKLALPPPEAEAFIRESTPYLLGSGGTLMFDVTIIVQSFLYRPKSHIHGRRISRTIDEEETGLLSAGATGAEDPLTPSRRRMALGGEGD